MSVAKTVKIRIQSKRQTTVPSDQAWFWTPEWQAKEKEAEAARAGGDYSEFDSVDDLTKSKK